MSNDDPVNVSYTVKELLAQLKSEMSDGFRRIEKSIGDVSGRIDSLERRVGSLEQTQRSQRSFLSGVSKPVIVIGGVAAWLIPMLVVLFHH